MMSTDVTAVVSCFNYGAYLPETVASVLNQEGGAPRVVVVDDGSTDRDTHAALDALPPAVEVVRQANAGVAAARNAGLSRADTPLVLVLDADDRLAPRALRAMREGLDAAPAAGFAYGHHRFIGGWSGELRFPPYDPLRLLDRHLIGATALTRREVIEQTGGFDPGFTAFEDWEFWVNALAHGWRGVRVDAVTLEYRRHGETKLWADRRRYRAARRRLRAKHAALYARRAELAAESDLGTAGRLTYRWFWGVRPVPAALEAAVHRTMWAAGGPR